MTRSFHPRALLRDARDLVAGAACRVPPGPGGVVVLMPAGPGSDGAVRQRIHETARALGGQGWRAVVLPWRLSLAARRRVIARIAPEVLVIQGVRHPLNRPHLYPGRPILLDVDDADFHLAHLAAPMEEAMAHVAGVVAGSGYIADWARARGVPARVVWTGTRVSPRAPAPDRPAVVAWAQTRPMTYVREAEMVRAAMAEVARRRPGTVLRLHDRRPDDDPAFADGFRAPGLSVEWRPALTYARYLDSLDDVAVGLAPLDPATPFSRGKSFGKVLAYLDRGAAVVASEAGEHGHVFDGGNGRLVRDAAGMADAVLAYLDDPALRARAARAGRATLARRLSIAAAAQGLSAALEAARPPPRPETGPETGPGPDAAGAAAATVPA